MFGLLVESTAPYLVISATGAGGLGEHSALNRFAGELCLHQGGTQLLLDVSRASPTLSFTEHLQLANVLQEAYARLLKVAVVVAKEADLPVVKAANRSGLVLKTFLNRESAVAWLAA